MLTLDRKKLSSISNQMTKVIHSDFSTVAGAMTSAFSEIEKNQAWDVPRKNMIRTLFIRYWILGIFT